ncbi:MAG: hypothetical protein CMN91_04960 [Synechococcus sp. ARS1019]|nr:hypothetical protein [Synechococcus sp. ARS1019]
MRVLVEALLILLIPNIIMVWALFFLILRHQTEIFLLKQLVALEEMIIQVSSLTLAFLKLLTEKLILMASAAQVKKLNGIPGLVFILYRLMNFIYLAILTLMMKID